MLCIMDSELVALDAASFRQVLERYPAELNLPRSYAEAFLEALRKDISAKDTCGELQGPLLSAECVRSVFGEGGDDDSEIGLLSEVFTTYNKIPTRLNSVYNRLRRSFRLRR